MKRMMLNVNGVDRWIVAEKSATLAEVLREQMLLTGCKVCCEDGQCGSCTVIIDGKPDRCMHDAAGEGGARREDHHDRRDRHVRKTCIRCRWRGWLTAALSAAFARRAS